MSGTRDVRLLLLDGARLVTAIEPRTPCDAVDLHVGQRGRRLPAEKPAQRRRQGRLERATSEQLVDAFGWACAYGSERVVDLFLDRGVDPDLLLNIDGSGHTGLHVAAAWGHADVVDALLRRGARVDAIDATRQATPLAWAVSGWSNEASTSDSYYAVVEQLLRAGATVPSDLLESDGVRSDPRMRALLASRP